MVVSLLNVSYHGHSSFGTGDTAVSWIYEPGKRGALQPPHFSCDDLFHKSILCVDDLTRFPSAEKARYRKLDSAGSGNSGSASGGSGRELDRPAEGQMNHNGINSLMATILWEMRLRRALRRLQDWTVMTIRRRCELRVFIALRVQYLFRSRKRRLAVLTIQRFYRKRRMTEGPLCPHNTA
jgi:hypothetical protein